MKSAIKTFTAFGVLVTSLHATNGDNLVGLGAKALGMGGTGIAHYNGSESAVSNPALITKGKGTLITFGGTYFTPSVEIQKTNASTGGTPLSASYESDAKNNVIPFVALTNSFDNGAAIGVSMYGSAGMGTDWRNNGKNPAGGADMGLYSMRSNLMLMKFSVPMAYGQDNWSVGIAPVMMYGALDIAFQNTYGATAPVAIQGTNYDVGRGSSSSFGAGFEAGAAYTVPEAGVTVAALYHSKIEMEYMNQISTAAAAFGYGASGAAMAGKSDRLDQPAEIGLGVDYTQGDLSITGDVKSIRWGDARGYQDFGWVNQRVYALGAEYRMDKLALRAGWNYGKNPIQNNVDARYVATNSIVGAGNTNGDTMNAFNHVLFPAVTERHYTVGAGYQFTKNVGTDVSFMYATSPDVSVSAASVALGTLTVKNDQMAVAANLNLAF